MNWDALNSELTQLRKELHKHPELSGKEYNTAERVVEFAKKYNPDKVISKLGGTGVAVVFNGKEDGKTVLIRCDLDALPIEEENDFEHRSRSENVSHKCGHDGHMSIVSGLIPLLSENKIQKGRVVLLYQPAEEIGQGAEWVLNDEKFEEIKPDYVYALHNLPKFKLGQVLIRDKNFAAASKGLIIRLKGKTAHAAHPERGIPPSVAVAELIIGLRELKNNEAIKDFSLVTIIHAKIGERAFGTTPGYAELMATLRSVRNDDMDLMTTEAEELISSIAKKHNLKNEIEWVEEFPATINNKDCVDIVRKSAEENGFSIHEVEDPFRWSEDFGQFTSRFPGALFGIGSGENHAPLHNPTYDFPDEIILTGTKMFYSIINKLLR